MHPRIKERYLSNLDANQDKARERLRIAAETFCNNLEKLIGCIDTMNASGILTMPDDFRLALAESAEAARQLNTESENILDELQQIKQKSNDACHLLNAYMKLQSTSTSLASLQSAVKSLSRSLDQFEAPPMDGATDSN